MGSDPSELGPNAWLVDELYEQYRADPTSVDEEWRAYFATHGSPSVIEAELAGETVTAATETETGPPARVSAPAQPEPAEPAEPAPSPDIQPVGEPIRGAGARIVENMEASLGVPTATSYRQVPARLLEVNRSVINGYLGRIQGGKVSFTHIIGYAVVRSVAAVPAMANTFVEDTAGAPRLLRHDSIGLGIAVDIERADGSRSLVVPCIRGADRMTFREFWESYESLITKVRGNKLSPDDFTGTTLSLTNVGTIGTVQSVPRLMPGQSAIIGVGSLGYSAEFAGADPATLADLGISKVMTLSSTYDHRIIQGAESGLFLQNVHRLLLGEGRFYEDLFASLEVPYEPVRWRQDINPVDRESSQLAKQMQVRKVVQMYRVRGHLIADLDPLRLKPVTMHPELDPATFGLTIWDNDREFLTDDLAGPARMKFGDMLHVLRDAYCRTVGIEYMHISSPAEKEWIQARVEGPVNPISPEEQAHILRQLISAEAFEKFLHQRYVGHKRFGIDGGESLIPLLDAVLGRAADDDRIQAVVMGMAHRGRLNVLANIVGKSLREIFKEFEGNVDPAMIQGSGDVKYHLGQRGKFTSLAGNEIEIELAANPSHLEAVDPVVVGMVRAREDFIDPPESFPVVGVLIHGDAAFAGQGVVAETLNLSTIPGYRVGGTIHIIVNNQVGYTTPPTQARSSEYPTDVAKAIQAPIFHVNGNDPEACCRVARLAFDYRQAFHKDVVIDMVCYRRHGHNEGDDPSYTQPRMYETIAGMKPVRELYAEALVDRGDITQDGAGAAGEEVRNALQAALDETRASAPPEGSSASLARHPDPPPRVATGVPSEVLERVSYVHCTYPEGFTPHPKLHRQLVARSEMFAAGEVDWGLAEAMAFGSLLMEGTPVRLAGQDSRRGTFAHRHAVLVDSHTEAEYKPLAHLDQNQARFWVYDSTLSEFAALGFEFGYSTQRPEMLVCWEAQFGDFVNEAQVIIDQFIAASEDKWGQRSGLVMLLPHGYEGQGPEHSSARIERFLILCAENNMCVVNATTSAQYFHMLRRQMRGDLRRPLVVFTPKSLLRSRHSRSRVEELVTGAFEEVLPDPSGPDPQSVRSVVLCSGKIAYEAMGQRDSLGASSAILRVEQLYPWPENQIRAELERYPNATELVWLQEEPANMGAWNFLASRLQQLAGDRSMRRVSRPESGSPATGSAAVHAQESEHLLSQLFG